MSAVSSPWLWNHWSMFFPRTSRQFWTQFIWCDRRGVWKDLSLGRILQFVHRGSLVTNQRKALLVAVRMMLYTNKKVAQKRFLHRQNKQKGKRPIHRNVMVLVASIRDDVCTLLLFGQNFGLGATFLWFGLRGGCICMCDIEWEWFFEKRGARLRDMRSQYFGDDKSLYSILFE